MLTEAEQYISTHFSILLVSDVFLTSLRYQTKDEAAAACIQAKKGLESYLYNLRNLITSDEKLNDKFEAGDKAKLESALNETIQWLDSSQEASRDEYEEKQKELQRILKKISTPRAGP
jgi:L1 cell adhesion molecule like protein